MVCLGLLMEPDGEVDVAAGGKESVWLTPQFSWPAGCVRPMTTVSAAAGWTVVLRVLPLIDPLDSRVPLVPP